MGVRQPVQGVDVRLAGHPLDPTEVVDMAMGVDDAHDRAIPPVSAIQRERGRSGLGADQRIDDEDAGVPLDEADVREIHAPDLVDAGNDLEQPVDRGQLRLAPKARAGGSGRRGIEEGIARVVPHDASVGGPYDARLEAADEAAPRVVEVGSVVERE